MKVGASGYISYTNTYDPIIMYCLGLFVVVYNVVYKEISMTSLFG